MKYISNEILLLLGATSWHYATASYDCHVYMRIPGSATIYTPNNEAGTYKVYSWSRMAACNGFPYYADRKTLIQSSADGEWTRVSCRGPGEFGGAEYCKVLIDFDYFDEDERQRMGTRVCDSCTITGDRGSNCADKVWRAGCGSYWEWTPDSNTPSTYEGYLEGIPQHVPGDCSYNTDCPGDSSCLLNDTGDWAYCDCNGNDWQDPYDECASFYTDAPTPAPTPLPTKAPTPSPTASPTISLAPTSAPSSHPSSAPSMSLQPSTFLDGIDNMLDCDNLGYYALAGSCEDPSSDCKMSKCIDTDDYVCGRLIGHALDHDCIQRDGSDASTSWWTGNPSARCDWSDVKDYQGNKAKIYGTGGDCSTDAQKKATRRMLRGE